MCKVSASSHLSVLSGFVSGEPPVDDLYRDPRLFKGMPHEEALELFEAERLGCELQLVRLSPLAILRGGEFQFEGVIHEGEVADPSSDFREQFNGFESGSACGSQAFPEPCFKDIGGALLVPHCTLKRARQLLKLQKTGCLGVTLEKKGRRKFYDLLFSVECREKLEKI